MELLNTSSENGKYVYLDQAASSISKAIGLDISEKHVDKISKMIGLPVFKIGNRRALTRETFVEKFDDFVKGSADELGGQTLKRAKGANDFNEKVDAIFSYVEYASSIEEAFTFKNCLSYLKAYDQEKHARWDELKLQMFVKAKGARKGCASNAKALAAKEYLSKHYENHLEAAK